MCSRACATSSLGIFLIPYGERRRRGTGVPLCYPPAWQQGAVSVRTVVPRARLEVWIGEVAASSLVTTRPVAPGQRRSRWEDCLYPPLPHLLLPCSPLSFWRMVCLDASLHRPNPILRPPLCCRPSTR